MNSEWLDREALVTVKAYPNPSAKHHETVCVAAITREEGWIRLHPVPFRSLPDAQRFKKYQCIRLRMQKHSRDTRPESFRPDADSIALGIVLGTRNRWSQRWEWVKPTLSGSMCEIQRLQKSTRKSLGVFRPKRVTDVTIRDVSANWSGSQQQSLAQLTLFDEQRKPLEKIPMIFRYKYVCDESGCRGHEQAIIDWELGELYRKVRNGSQDRATIKTKIRDKYLHELCGTDRDTHFFVGNHSQHPQSFLVLGVFWPPRASSREERVRTLF